MWRIGWSLFLIAATAGAWAASSAGFGVTAPLNEPVSIRQESVDTTGRRGRSGPMFIYFSGSGRRHRGGGLYGGK